MRPRWWPAVVILVVWAVALGWTWVRPLQARQDRVIATMVASSVAVVALLVWFLLLSGLSSRTRRVAGLALALLVVVGVLTLRLGGFTGDVRPILAWRWSAGPASVPDIDRGTVTAVDIRPTLADSPQFLGPRRIGVVDGVLLAREWQSEAPLEIWRRAVGAGWGSFAIQGDIAVTLEQRGDQEAVVAYELGTGTPVWFYAYAARYDNPVAGLGPRSTPTIDGDRVYSMGATGILTALDLAAGTLLWQRDVVRDNHARVPTWGKSCSPLVYDGQVVVSAGGSDGRSLVAYAADTGEPLWGGGNSPSGYASPMLVTLTGVRQVVIFNHGSVVGHDPVDGRVLWRFPWPGSQPNVAQPLQVAPDSLIVSSGYGIGAKRFRIASDAAGNLTPELQWESIRLKAKFAHFVERDATLYGLDDGVLTAVDPETGKRLWKRGRYGHGQLLLVEDLLLIQAEDGDLVLASPNPHGLTELARIRALDSKTWNVPSMAGSRVLLRNDREAVLLQLPVRR